MGQIALNIPQVGQPDSTEDPKIATGLATIQTVINGNVDDTNLRSPNNSVRRTLLQAQGIVGGGSGVDNRVFLAGGGFPVSTGNSVGSQAVPSWVDDVGLSGQPKDFQVANLAAYARIRATILVNGVAPASAFNVGLYQLTSASGSGSLAVNFSGAANYVAIPAPAASSVSGGESAAFALPGGGAVWALGVYNTAPTAANSLVSITASLVAYNA